LTKCETIYVIDDDDVCQFIANSVITESKLVNHIKMFNNGKEAIDFIEENITDITLLPEIILLDLTMPVMDGWEFLENYILLKPRIGKKIYIYVLTSSTNPKDFERAKNINEVTDYVVKPITIENFVELLKSF